MLFLMFDPVRDLMLVLEVVYELEARLTPRV
jgi:hypothetical protein